MGANSQLARASMELPGLPDNLANPHWYALYTSANHEKSVAAELGRRNVENFLAQYTSVRRWKDRRVSLELPLFPSYVFVRLALRDRLCVLRVPGVARLVGFGGLPAALPEEQVEALRAGLAGHLHVEPHPYLAVGHRVRIVRGPLCGAEGSLVRKKGKEVFRVVLSLELILRSVVVEVDATDVVPCSVQEI